MMIRFYQRFRIQLLLFVCALLIYLFNFPQVLLQPNSLLSGTSEDALKNYFTFLYHIRFDKGLLHFSGMNYPFGEHVVYTDCQPMLTFIFKLLPFTHQYLVGILHWLIFLSFMITPVILFRILKHLNVEDFSAFFIALGISILSPQYFKVCLGHYALAYSFIIPLEILLLLLWFENHRRRHFILLMSFNILLFLHHPYIGLSVAIFCFLSVFFRGLIVCGFKNKFRTWLYALLAGLFPIVLFTVFLALTDKHPERAAQPYGVANWNLDYNGLLVPQFGPFQKLMESVFGHPPFHFEAYNYLGLFLITFLAAFLITLPFTWKKLIFSQGMLALFFAAVLLLVLAFGTHLWLMEITGIQINALNQFRATGRFGWFFYYMLPLLISGSIIHFFKSKTARHIARILTVLFFVLNLIEAHYFFRMDEHEHWKTRNFFNEELLTEKEQSALALIRNKNTQAILPFRFFHGGSEMYERQGIYFSMPSALFYSYHSGLPIASSFMSRTSLVETEELINILNPYKRERKVLAGLSKAPFTVIKENTELLPDEKRISERVKYVEKYDSLEIGFIQSHELLNPKPEQDVLTVEFRNYESPTKDGVVFIAHKERKPFLSASQRDYENFFTLDSNLVEPGDYAVSLRLYYNEKIHQSHAVHLIVTEAVNGQYSWRYNFSLRVPSGLYPGFSVHEQRIQILKGGRYEFMTTGFHDRQYHISHFMLRPEKKTIIMTGNGSDSLINNFPR